VTVAGRAATGGRLRPARRPPAASGKAAVAGGSVLLMLYVATIFLPGTFPVGPVVLTPYRLILLAAFVPLFLQLVRGRVGPITGTDIAVFLLCCWIALSIYRHHGPSRIIFIGTNFAEIFGAYLIGRVLVRSHADYKAFFRYFLIALAVLLPFALVEMIAGKRLYTELFNHILSTRGYVSNKPRLGLTRVTLPFHNPIHFGVVCSIAVANVYCIWRDSLLKSLRLTGFAIFMTFTALSSGPLFSVALQITMLAWDRIVRFLKARWFLLAGIAVFTYAVLELALPQGLVRFIVDRVIFNPVGGENRIAIIQYGIAEILRHPVLGIGLNDWTRPFWQSSTVDNFWIVLGMRYGLPAVGLLLFAVGLNGWRISDAARLSPEAARYRTGYLIAFAGTVLVMGTVHVWDAPQVLVMTYLGAGSWFYTSAAEGWRAPEDPRARRLARQAAGEDGADARAPRPVPPRRRGGPAPAPPPGSPLRPPRGERGAPGRADAARTRPPPR
jgi:hypothetical protein